MYIVFLKTARCSFRILMKLEFWTKQSEWKKEIFIIVF